MQKTTLGLPGIMIGLALLSGCHEQEPPPGGSTFDGYPGDTDETTHVGLVQGETLGWESKYLEGKLTVAPGFFSPWEAENKMLPFMKAHVELFRGKSVLEIGAGSGINALYAAQLGATRVVATDINELAIANIRDNAAARGVGDIVEARLVPLTDMSAYSVIGSDERFDTIFSNPPYALDLDAPTNDAVTDTGDLGFSIVRGLDVHLEPGGAAVLNYNSVFYRYVMVKFARHSGFEVRQHDPKWMMPWETATLFNAYLARLLEREGVCSDAFRFDRESDHAVSLRLPPEGTEYDPLFPGKEARRWPGMMVVQSAGER